MLKTDIFEQWTFVPLGNGHWWFDIITWIDNNYIAKDDYDVYLNGFYFKNDSDAVMFKLKWG